jgi:hypothetical protein
MGHPQDVEAVIRREFMGETWLLDGARSLAVSLQDVLAANGRPVNYALFLERTQPLFRYLNGFLRAGYDALDLRVPSPGFHVRTILQPGECDKRYCMYMDSKSDSQSTPRLRAYSNYSLTDTAAARVKDSLISFFEEFSCAPLHGERLQYQRLRCERYKTQRAVGSYSRDGFEFEFGSWHPVTWPWVELYLRHRREFRPRERVSFEFIS